MKKFMMLVAGVCLLFAGSLHAQDIVGNWQGTLQAGKGLRTIIKISKVDGKLKGVFYTIDQSPKPIDVTSVTLDGTAFAFEIKPFELTYAGTLSGDGKTITGNATQGGQAHVLNFDKVTEEAMWPIPEAPKPMAADANPGFDVVTVKPSSPDQQGKYFTVRGRHIITANTSVDDLITMAYGLNLKEIVNAPAWFASDKFDIDGIPDVEGQPSTPQLKILIQKALVDRFGLKFHYEDKELTAYVLTVDKSGPKMKVTTDKPNEPKNFFFRKLGVLTVSNSSMKDFCDGMQMSVMDKPVVDHTGLKDRYDFQLTWTPDESQFTSMGIKVPPPDPNDAAAPPGLYTAMQEQLGLKMEAAKTMAPAMVIDKVEKPGAN